MTDLVRQLLEKYRQENAIPEHKPLDDEQIKQFLLRIGSVVVKIEGIWAK